MSGRDPQRFSSIILSRDPRNLSHDPRIPRPAAFLESLPEAFPSREWPNVFSPCRSNTRLRGKSKYTPAFTTIDERMSGRKLRPSWQPLVEESQTFGFVYQHLFL